MSDDVTTTVRRTLKTAFYDDIQVQVGLVGDSRKVVDCLIMHQKMFTGEKKPTITRIHSLGDGIEKLVSLHHVIGILLKELEEHGIGGGCLEMEEK